jgi:galactose oxidase
MRDPAGAVVAGSAVTIISGNQFRGPGGNPGNQLQTGSAIFFKKSTGSNWTSVPMLFFREVGNNKYYSASIPANAFNPGDVGQYYLRIPYSDHDTTFVHASGAGSATTAVEATAQGAPFSFTAEDPAQRGQWGPVFDLPNVAVHANVLPTGRVLMWGRRDNPGDTLDEEDTTPFIWNPADGSVQMTDPPKRANEDPVNIFCSGHTFLEDGRLLVVGGHRRDSDGIDQAVLYNAATNQWIPTAPMTAPNGDEVRRWYPTLTTLPNGDVLVFAGSFINAQNQTVNVDLIQIWSNGTWKTIPQANGMPLSFIGPPLYPRLHVASDGRVLLSGPVKLTQLMKTTTPGRFDVVGNRQLGVCDYCPAVMFDRNRVMFIGGGEPTARVEVIDLSDANPQWQFTGSMKFARRQHNAAILPDGTVLVVGGTRGAGFNNLDAGQSVHMAELWDPATRSWRELSAELVDRCYHSTAVLLPDGRVLSAGGGEYKPIGEIPNDPQDSHRNGQVFSPPYLFKGPRPNVTSAPTSVNYGDSFDVGTDQASRIRKVTWIRLPSVTHSFDENQRINILDFQAGSGKITVTAPASRNECPPGHHMLFLVNDAGVPSIARIVQIKGVAPQDDFAALADVAPGERAPSEAELVSVAELLAQPGSYLRVYARQAEIEQAEKGTRVVVGITVTCPYGIGACWGGPYEALGHLDGVAYVKPVPNTDDSTAEVFLKGDALPPLDKWEEKYSQHVAQTSEMRGVEVTLRGTLQQDGGGLTLAGGPERPAVALRRLAPHEKVQWTHAIRERKPPEPSETGAYDTLMAAVSTLRDGQEVTVTGPLKRDDTGYELHVRTFEM